MERVVMVMVDDNGDDGDVRSVVDGNIVINLQL
jgi:hypothetical protein